MQAISGVLPNPNTTGLRPNQTVNRVIIVKLSDLAVDALRLKLNELTCPLGPHPKVKAVLASGPLDPDVALEMALAHYAGNRHTQQLPALEELMVALSRRAPFIRNGVTLRRIWSHLGTLAQNKKLPPFTRETSETLSSLLVSQFRLPPNREAILCCYEALADLALANRLDSLLDPAINAFNSLLESFDQLPSSLHDLNRLFKAQGKFFEGRKPILYLGTQSAVVSLVYKMTADPSAKSKGERRTPEAFSCLAYLDFCYASYSGQSGLSPSSLTLFERLAVKDCASLLLLDLAIYMRTMVEHGLESYACWTQEAFFTLLVKVLAKAPSVELLVPVFHGFKELPPLTSEQIISKLLIHLASLPPHKETTIAAFTLCAELAQIQRLPPLSAAAVAAFSTLLESCNKVTESKSIGQLSRVTTHLLAHRHLPSLTADAQKVYDRIKAPDPE